MTGLIRNLIVMFALAAWLAAAPVALARQHLIQPGEGWENLASRLKAGDEVILMPGRHRPASFKSIAGEQGQPIIIRGLAKDTPSVIAADRYGLELHRCRHIIVQDLAIEGASIAGLLIDDTPADPGRAPFQAGISLRGLTISRTGPEGQRHGISLLGVTNVNLDGCTVHGWGGAAVSIVASQQVNLSECRFAAMPDHSQLAGLVIRAGSASVSVTRCRFEEVHDTAVILGWRSDLDDFHPAPPSPASASSIFEASAVTIERNLFLNCGRILSVAHVNDWQFRNNTIIRPRGTVLSLALRQEESTFSKGGTGSFSSNLITWQAGDLAALGEASTDVNAAAVQIGRNLWWSDEPVEKRASLLPLPGRSTYDQVLLLDPQLDDKLRPQASAAEIYGWGS